MSKRQLRVGSVVMWLGRVFGRVEEKMLIPGRDLKDFNYR